MPNLKINRKLEKLLKTPKPIKVVIGGRGSGKSIGLGDIFTLKMATENADIYCLREFQDSVLDSVHRVFVDSIQKRMNLQGWTIQENRVISPTGSRTIYKGASRNPDSIQSAQGYKYSWFEEAHRASKSSLDKLLPTIIRNPGAECWFSANPQSSADPFSQRFIVPYLEEIEKNGFYEDDVHMIQVINWRDNPWWNDEQEAIRKWDYENRPRAEYDWIWEGKFNDSVEGSIIKPEWFDAAVDAHKIERLENVFKPHGAIVAAHDPFDDGGDAGSISIRHGPIIKLVQSKNAGEIDEVCDWATGISIQNNVDWFVWDGDGMGAGLKRQVSDAFSGKNIKYHMFRGSLSGSAQDNAEQIYMSESGDSDTNPKKYKETFKNNRAQYYIDLAGRFYNTYKCVMHGEYIDPDLMISIDSNGVDNIIGLKSQLCRIPRKANNAGLEQIMSKQDMKKMGINSPNDADSIMMTLFKPEIEEAVNINFKGWG
jgi:phage terminase large subunit